MSVLKVGSTRLADTFYTVDTDEKTCTCLQFHTEGYCKHLEQVGVYQDKKWSQKTHPTFSQALSGLVKSLRIRRVEDAVYWLVYLDSFTHLDQGARFRVARRLLIGSAEDGHSIAVMERVAKNFPHLCQKGTGLIELVAEAMRICYVDNWWKPETGGHDYIYSGMISLRRQGFYREYDDVLEVQKDGLIAAIADKNAVEALCWMEGILGNKDLGRTALAQWLNEQSIKVGCEEAKRLTDIHLSAKSALSGDANFLMQAAWWMAGGESEVTDSIEKVMSGDAKSLIHDAQKRWKDPEPIPGWCCDGVHCGGTDRRFAGMWPDMYAVCQAYMYYLRVDPNDEWLDHFYVLEGLRIG